MAINQNTTNPNKVLCLGFKCSLNDDFSHRKSVGNEKMPVSFPSAIWKAFSYMILWQRVRNYRLCQLYSFQKNLSSLTLSQTTNFRLLNWKRLQTTISKLMKMAESSPNGCKTLWEKEKLLVTSNFSFSHSVFKRLVLQTRRNQGLFGNGLNQDTVEGISIFHCVLQISRIIYSYYRIIRVDLFFFRVVFFSTFTQLSA